MKKNTLLLLSLLCTQYVTAMESPSNSGSESSYESDSEDTYDSEDSGEQSAIGRIPVDPNVSKYIERIRTIENGRLQCVESLLHAAESANVPLKGIEKGKKYPVVILGYKNPHNDNQ